jgi:hypothetical protein
VLLPDSAGPLGLNGYNSFLHPRAYDRASHRRLIAIKASGRTAYVDRCAIDYGGRLCREFRVTDLTCEQAWSMQRREAELAFLADFFQRTDPDRQALNALKRRCDGWVRKLDLYRFTDASG